MEKPTGRSKKEAREEKLKDQKLEEIILKSLDDYGTTEDKLKFLLRKHFESEKKILTLCNELKGYQRNFEVLQRDKEQMQREMNKNVLMRDKLQEVCREQQKIIKSVKNESLLKIREEEERRKESQYKFQASLNEITESLNKNNEENLKLRDYNVEMTKKLRFLAEQYETREKQLEKLNEQVALEGQLHRAKLNKAQVEAAMEKEILTKENQIGLEKLLQAQRAIKELTDREQDLKNQLHIYTSKYDEFQKSLQKSNEVFVTYKQELDKMSKHTKKIEKEALGWRVKYEKSNAMVIELATEKQYRDNHAERCNKQVDQLQKLLRALQSERTNLHKTLRDNQIEIPPMPKLPPEPEPMKIEPVNQEQDKMEMMSRNCAQLKETLTNLQKQMRIITANETKEAQAQAAAAEAAAKLEQQKAEEAAKLKAKKKKNKKDRKRNKAGQQETEIEAIAQEQLSAAGDHNSYEGKESSEEPMQLLQECTETDVDGGFETEFEDCVAKTNDSEYPSESTPPSLDSLPLVSSGETVDSRLQVQKNEKRLKNTIPFGMAPVCPGPDTEEFIDLLNDLTVSTTTNSSNQQQQSEQEDTLSSQSEQDPYSMPSDVRSSPALLESVNN